MKPRTDDLRRRRFSYLEIIAVMVILAILTALLLPKITHLRGSSARSTCEFNLLTLGMALKSYADDHKLYPMVKPMVSALKTSGYIGGAQSFHCPADTSTTIDSYSVGYLGGHPATIRPHDPLIVCGWHKRIGTLAVFPDASVGILDHLHQNQSEIIPITVTQGSGDVAPGFMLHESNAVTIASEDGNQALLYGKNGPYFISASYDPTAFSGTGLFTVMVGFDLSSSQNQNVSTQSSTSYVEIQASFEYCNVVMLYDPASPTPGKLSWKPGALILPNEVITEFFKHYRIAHTYNGQFYDVDYVSGNNLDRYTVAILVMTQVE